MSVTIDLKALMLIIIAIAVIVLTIYLVRLLKKLMLTLDETNKVLQDVQVVTDIAAARSKDVDDIVGNVSDTVTSVVDAIKGNQSAVAAFTAVVKAIASLQSVVSKDSKKE